MKKLIFAFALLFTFINIYSQSSNDSHNVNSLKRGKVALQIETGEVFSSSMFEKLTVAVKPQFSESFAIRLGASFDLGSGKNEDAITYAATPQTESKSIDGLVFLNLMFQFNTNKAFTHYAGIGPVFGYNEFKSDNVSVSETGALNTFHHTSKNIYGGAMALLGLEWFFHERISLLAEYNLIMKFGKYRSTSTTAFHNYIDVRNEDKNLNQLEAVIFKIGASIYF